MPKGIRVDELIWGKKKPKRRKPVRVSVQKELLSRAEGKCERCGLKFHEEKVTPRIHHKDGDPKNNKLSNLLVVCPNCHDILHKKMKPKKKKTERKKRPSVADYVFG